MNGWPASGRFKMWSFVFDGNQFKGEILPELERLKKEQVIRLIDLLLVRKDSTGAVATLTATDLDWEEASSFGAPDRRADGLGQRQYRGRCDRRDRRSCRARVDWQTWGRSRAASLCR